jgi:hypothetical protein
VLKNPHKFNQLPLVFWISLRSIWVSTIQFSWAVGLIDWLDVIIINLRLGGLDVAIKQRQRNQITRKLALSKFANWALCLCHIGV